MRARLDHRVRINTTALLARHSMTVAGLVRAAAERGAALHASSLYSALAGRRRALPLADAIAIGFGVDVAELCVPLGSESMPNAARVMTDAGGEQ